MPRRKSQREITVLSNDRLIMVNSLSEVEKRGKITSNIKSQISIPNFFVFFGPVVAIALFDALLLLQVACSESDLEDLFCGKSTTMAVTKKISKKEVRCDREILYFQLEIREGRDNGMSFSSKHKRKWGLLYLIISHLI